MASVTGFTCTKYKLQDCIYYIPPPKKSAGVTFINHQKCLIQAVESDDKNKTLWNSARIQHKPSRMPSKNWHCFFCCCIEIIRQKKARQRYYLLLLVWFWCRNYFAYRKSSEFLAKQSGWSGVYLCKWVVH